MNPATEKLRERGRHAYPRSLDQRKRWSRQICDFIAASPAFGRAGRVGIFYPCLWEVNLVELWGKYPQKCVFPRTYRESGKLAFFALRALEDLKPGYGGIPAPPDVPQNRVDEWDESDLILVPGLCFDLHGGRLGTGHGYYDRFLGPNPAKAWGVCWQAQVVDSPLPQHENDVSVVGLCTELGLSLF
ncbi:MAG: 5-formyltetrahydrofolate cyclo-ligase [Bdellovibrionales bacterium]|nr:5-formyltetrahydrofolate cyclo-ligase [Bdellovibrionales bacterium]